MRALLTRWLTRVWYDDAASGIVLRPLAALYGAAVRRRRRRYRQGLEPSVRVGVPVIVVGNIAVGGTGKTPFVIELVRRLLARGCSPAVVTRGYGGATGAAVAEVGAGVDAAAVGDEPLLIERRTGVRVYVSSDRVAAARTAVADGADVIVADDGLQHYALGRDIEIAIVDGARRNGNGRLLPAGPLREPESRLAEVDLVVHQVAPAELAADAPAFALTGDSLVRCAGGAAERLAGFAGRAVVAMAAVGNPGRFFESLERAGLLVERVALPDHAPAAAYPLARYRGRTIVVTEKDAVKICSPGLGDVFFLPVRAELSAAAAAAMDALLRDRLPAAPGERNESTS